MGEPVSILGQSRAFAQDFPRDQMPPGYLWDVVDFVPALIDASLTGRGGWTWASDSVSSDIASGILATFLSGDQLLVQTSAGVLFKVDQTTGAVTNRGGVWGARQNPVQLFDTVVHFDTSRTYVPMLITDTAITTSHSSAPRAAVGTIWRNTVAADGGPGKEDTVHFGTPGQPAAAWDAASFQGTSGAITGLGAIRSVLLVFHAGSVEKIRGDEIPSLAGDVTGNLIVEPLSTDVGCPEPKTIAYWTDNLIFADEHGVHMTDGSVIRNVVSQGGISTYWRTLWGARTTVAAGVFLDYYVITIRTATGPVTLICDLTRRQWFRFSHINTFSYIASAGGTGAERLWAGIAGSNRLAQLGPCFFPNLYTTTTIIDADGVVVAPVFETPWYRLTKEGRKRIKFAYLSYDARGAVGGRVVDLAYLRSPSDTSYLTLGQFPATTQYRRYRLPLGQAPYGVGFRVRQVGGTSALRIYDLAVEAGEMVRSRV